MGAQPIPTDGDDVAMRELKQQAMTSARLSERDQATLLERSARGDRASQDRLVAANLAMVIRLAEARHERGLSVPDLVQEGSLGLVEAVHTFATDGGGDFAAFAERKVAAQMDAAIAAEASAIREGEQLVAAANDYERVEILLRKTLRRPATEAEIAQKLEWTVDRTRYIAEVVADARRRHDEELLAFIDPESIDVDGVIDRE
jgi:RNA polymerase primary sigma factor